MKHAGGDRDNVASLAKTMLRRTMRPRYEQGKGETNPGRCRERAGKTNLTKKRQAGSNISSGYTLEEQ